MARRPPADHHGFFLRSLARRVVIIGQGARKCWRGEVGTQPVPVRITVAMETGRTKLGFYTPTHGVAEGASAGARALAFALYDPKIIFAGDAP